MKWHKGSDLPVIDSDMALCVVQYKYPIPDYTKFDTMIYELHYELLVFHKITNAFSKQDDKQGVNGLRPDLIVKWAYIEEDDDIIEEV